MILDVAVAGPVAIGVPFLEGSGKVHARTVVEPQNTLELAGFAKVFPWICPEPLDILVTFAKMNRTGEVAPIRPHCNRKRDECRRYKYVAADNGHVVLGIELRSFHHEGMKSVSRVS